MLCEFCSCWCCLPFLHGLARKILATWERQFSRDLYYVQDSERGWILKFSNVFRVCAARADNNWAMNDLIYRETSRWIKINKTKKRFNWSYLDLRLFESYAFLFRRDSGSHVRQRREPQQLDRVLLHRGRGGPLAPRFAWIPCIHKLALIVERLFVTFKYKLENIHQKR